MFPLMLLMLAADPSPEPEPPYSFEVKASAKAETKVEKGVPVIVLSGRIDRGEGKIVLNKGTAPKKVVLRFAGMASLDTIKLSSGRASAYISRGMAGGDGGLTVSSRAIKGGVEVEIASKEGMKEWYFGWHSGERFKDAK
ncbi:MAG: hypothetical protein K2W96_09995 [Gemmataceae bacterium]|nr:hypothetical protein [Gemmataceae bacterium]